MGWERVFRLLDTVVAVGTTEQFSAKSWTSSGDRTVYCQVARTGGDDTADTLVKVYDAPDPEAASPAYSEVPYVDLRMPAGATKQSMGFSFKAVPGFRLGLALSAAEASQPTWTIKLREG
jgi:hypothetical protein